MTLPAPQPRSTTRAGDSSGTWASRSSAGRSRSPANRRYCAGSQTAAARATSVPIGSRRSKCCFIAGTRRSRGREQQKAKRVDRFRSAPMPREAGRRCRQAGQQRERAIALSTRLPPSGCRCAPSYTSADAAGAIRDTALLPCSGGGRRGARSVETWCRSAGLDQLDMPPCATIRSRTIASPRPVPPRRMLPANGRNSSACTASGSPGPSSAISTQRRAVMLGRDVHLARTGLRGIAQQVGQHAEQLGAVGVHQDREVDRVDQADGAARAAQSPRPRRPAGPVRPARRAAAGTLARVVQCAAHQIGRAVDGLGERLAGALHLRDRG